MEIKRTIEISVEKTRRFVLRQPETDEAISCPTCGEQMLTAEAAAVLLRTKYRRIYQIAETGAAHFLETETGAMFVCPSSFDEIIDDVKAESPAETVKLLTDPATEKQIEEIHIKEKAL